MIFQSRTMRLNVVRTVARYSVNDVYICQDLNVSSGTLYTLLVIRNHEAAKKYIEIFAKTGSSRETALIDCFAKGNHFCMVFPYSPERPLETFYMGNSFPLEQCEDICSNLIISCVTGKMSWPFLYLILTQKQLNLASDNSIYFSYQIDLSEFNADTGEKQCVIKCAEIILSLLEAKASSKAVSYLLLSKKRAGSSYNYFTELYRDVKLASESSKKQTLVQRIKGFYRHNKDFLFLLLLRLCIAVSIAVLISFVSQMIFGDIPWLRIFINGFKIIGTENLAR